MAAACVPCQTSRTKLPGGIPLGGCPRAIKLVLGRLRPARGRLLPLLHLLRLLLVPLLQLLRLLLVLLLDLLLPTLVGVLFGQLLMVLVLSGLKFLPLLVLLGHHLVLLLLVFLVQLRIARVRSGRTAGGGKIAGMIESSGPRRIRFRTVV